MAAWGCGDPRWLVEHRDDGKNVNGWHWEEKGRLEWSKQRLGELFSNVRVECDEGLGSWTFTGLQEATGEASITTRKGNKKFAVFDLKVTVTWEAQLPGRDKPVKGTLRVGEFMSTLEADEYELSVTVEGTGEAQDAAKKVAMQVLKAKGLELLAQFITDIGATV